MREHDYSPEIERIRQSFIRHENHEPFLNQIDFSLLESLFQDHAQQSGCNIRRDFLGKQGIRSMNLGQTAFFDLDADIIGIDYSVMNRQMRETRDDEPYRTLEYLLLLCHEEVHAVSGKTGSKRQYSIGYLRVVPQGEYSTERRYDLFNEIVSSKLANAVFEEYVRKSNLASTEQLQIFRGYENDNPAVKKFRRFGEDLLDRICEVASKGTDTNPQKIWQTLIRGLFRGADIANDAELQRILKKALKPHGIKKLAIARTLEDLKQLVKTDD